MNTDSAHNNHWQIGETVFGIPFLIGIAMQFVLPLSLAQGVWRWVLVAVGVGLVLIGITVIVQARRELAQSGQPTDPGHPTSQVVTTGVFAISRNPLYLGAAVLLMGVALALNNAWTVAAVLLGMVLCHVILIVPEESYLAAKFGPEYAAYNSTVRRWLGRK